MLETAVMNGVLDAGGAWMRCMRRGDFEAAWRISDAVRRERAGQPCWDRPRHEQWIWNGESPAGKRVLVRCYHGLGDTVQFIRYAPILKSVAREVVVWAQPALLPLLETVPGIDELRPLHDGSPETEYDLDVELMELPHVFRTTLETIPNAVPYLRVPRGERIDGELAVGVTWRAGEWDRERWVPAGLVALLALVPGVRLYVLQDRASAGEWPEVCGPMLCPDSVTGLAEAIAMMDLVITVDTLTAHLAGALGVRTWTLLPKVADWRWMEERSDSPWYPTMTLWRQENAGEWEPVMERVARELRELAMKRTTHGPE
jgi:ADP-heptose:LPS heptosyltransferase